MANITKNQIKKRLKDILETLEKAKDLLSDLTFDVEDESANIEPYDGKDELTPQQEERQEYLSDLYDDLSEQLDNLDELTNNIDNLIY